MYKIKYKGDLPYTASLGKRGVPSGSTEVLHADGTKVYIVPQTSAASAAEMLVLQSKFDGITADMKYLQFAYVEHILDCDDPDMFLLILEDFKEWHKKINY